MLIWVCQGDCGWLVIGYGLSVRGRVATGDRPYRKGGWWLEGNKKGAPCERAYKNSNMYLFAFDVRPGGC